MGQSSSTPTINKNDQAIFKLKLQRDSLIKYNTNLGLLINNDIDQAKACLARKDRQRALAYVKRRKAHQQLLGKTLGQIDTLEELISTIQIKLIEKDFIQSLQQGSQILKVLNKECNANKVDSVMDEARNQIDIQNEVSDLISHGNLNNINDDEIEEDMAKLEKEVKGETNSNEAEGLVDKITSIPKTDNIPIFPNVDPNIEIKLKEKEEEEKSKQTESDTTNKQKSEQLLAA